MSNESRARPPTKAEQFLGGKPGCSAEHFLKRKLLWRGEERPPRYADELLPGSCSVLELNRGCPGCLPPTSGTCSCGHRLVFIKKSSEHYGLVELPRRAP